MLACISLADAQVRPGSALPVAKTDSIPPTPVDSAVVDLSKVKISNDGLEDEVQYQAQDSMWFDVQKKQVHLYGGAQVKYTNLTITAGYILLDYDKSEIAAEPFPDTTKQLAGYPDFKDGEQNFSAGKLRYNFKTKKGIIYEARTQQEDMYVLGQKAKFIGSPDSQDTTKSGRTTIYNANSIITTCDHPTPHFGIRARKLKVIPNKLVVTGLSNLEIAGVPTPLVLPFGFFPISKTRKAGLIIPRDFQFARVEGLGINDFGWYQPVSEHADITTLCSLYVNGSWGARSNIRYDYKYKFKGDFNLEFNNRVNEDARAQRVNFRSFGLRWSHNQDPKAHPTRTFGGSVNIQTNQNQNRNRNDFNSVIQNTLTSNLNYSQRFPGKPYQFNASMRHSQNTQTRRMDISLPTANFTLQRVFPFKKKTPGIKEFWYEKISVTYSSQLDNQLSTVDTLLFTRRTLESARMGIQHRASTDYNFKVLKFINITPSMSYDESWYPYSIRKDLIRENRIVYDTIKNSEGVIVNYKVNETKSQYGIDTTYREWGFNSFRNWNLGVGAGTALFFTKQFKKGWFRGIRHTMKPSISTGFGPDFSRDKYYRFVETDTRPKFNDTVRYSKFDDGLYGKPIYSAKRDIVLSYSLINLLEIKHRTKRDTTDPNDKGVKKMRIFDNLGFSGNYNLTADSLKWSQIGTGGLFRLFKGISNLTWNATFDPYITNAKGQRINRFAYREQGRLLRTTNLGVALNTNFQMKQLRQAFGKKNKGEQNSTDSQPNTATTAEKVDNFFAWFDGFGISHRIGFERRLIPTGLGTERDTIVITTNNISLTGELQLNANWTLGFGNIGYDFPTKQLTYPDLRISRDLHCWQLFLSWQPTRGTYNFTINVNPGTLDFIKIPYRKNNFDSRL